MHEAVTKEVEEDEFDLFDIHHWLKVFQGINRECSIHGEPIHLFHDTEYYTEQIHILMDERNYELARVLALGLARI